MNLGKFDARDKHRPESVIGRHPAILDLRRQGLTPRDIAQALRVHVGEVLEALRMQERAT